jgi:hypothetical protein
MSLSSESDQAGRGVKALDGTGGLLDALVSANAAAPLALPDLVLLPRPLLESAALKGLLHPYDGLSSLMDDPSWFDYARQLAHFKSSRMECLLQGMPWQRYIVPSSVKLHQCP